MKKVLWHAIIIGCGFITNAVYTGDIQDIKNRADTCAQEEKFTEAISLYTQCYGKNPYDVHSMLNAAICLLKLGKATEAINLFEKIIPLVQNPTAIRYNIGYAYKVSGNPTQAIEIYKDIIAANPDYDAAHFGLGFAYLEQGDYKRGWEQHSRYLKKAGKNGEELRMLLAQNNIAGKKILLTYEGGLGDTLMFIRYAERLKNMGGTLICMVQKPLIPLLSLCPYIDTIMPYNTNFPEHDARASLMSLPALFNDNEETIPTSVPYIYPEKKRVLEWQKKIAPYNTLKIGICWECNIFNDSSRLPIARRGIPLSLFEPLLADTRFTFFNLQKEDGVNQAELLGPQCTLISYKDLDTNHGSFMDTAALIHNLDLVIAIDSAVAHLSGALGVPTLLLLPYSTDWRWIINRSDSPWYPHHTILKQPAPFDWKSVIPLVSQYIESLYLSKKDSE